MLSSSIHVLLGSYGWLLRRLVQAATQKPLMNISSRVVAGGALWALVYNLVWGVAWFAFMRREWIDATAALNRPMPWSEIWGVWVALTVPLGVATMAYVAGRARSGAVPRAALVASLVVWVPMTVGMTGWGWYESLSFRVLTLDSAVNLVAIAAASLAGEWINRIRVQGRKAV